jgi:hypothetical protein
LGRKRSDRDVALEEAPALPGGLLSAAYRSSEAAKMESAQPAAHHTNESASRLYKLVGAIFALAGVAFLVPTAIELFKGGGPNGLGGVLFRLIPGPALVIGGLVLFEKGRLMEPHGLHDHDEDRLVEPAYRKRRGKDDAPAPYADRGAEPSFADREEVLRALTNSGTPVAGAPADPARPIYHSPVQAEPVAPRPPPPRIVPRVPLADRTKDDSKPFVAAMASADAPPPARGEPIAFVPPEPVAPAAAAQPAPVQQPAPAPVAQQSPVSEPSLTPGSDLARQARASVNPADSSVVEIYRNWVLAQALGSESFQPLTVNDRYDEWFLLSASGVATLLAWTHEDHGATYSADTWVDQILPTQGIVIADRQLAIDLVKAAALHAGGLHTAPTERLTAYHPSELVTAMATVHVGLLRLYSGLEGSNPAKVLRDQLGDSPMQSISPSGDAGRWLPPGS